MHTNPTPKLFVERGRAIAHRLPRLASDFIKHVYGRIRLRHQLRSAAAADPEVMRKWGIDAVPPPELRMRVHGAADLESFLATGKWNYESLLAGLDLAQRPIDATSRVLDFGCGSGRTLRWWVNHPARPILYGTDVDRETAQWVRDNLAVETHVNEPLPPLPFPNEHFDVLYAISVFTHLDEQYQDAWLAELKRVLRKDGVALLTVRSQEDIASRSLALQEQIQRDGIVFEYDWMTAQFFPDFYQVTYHSADYIERHWGAFFRIIGRITTGYVELLVLTKR
jgi:SAM-dependent methyltransferase